MSLADDIREALAERKKAVECPAMKTWLGDKLCPKCGASKAGPCWEGVRADSIFIDRVKELVQ